DLAGKGSPDGQGIGGKGPGRSARAPIRRHAHSAPRPFGATPPARSAAGDRSGGSAVSALAPDLSTGDPATGDPAAGGPRGGRTSRRATSTSPSPTRGRAAGPRAAASYRRSAVVSPGRPPPETAAASAAVAPGPPRGATERGSVRVNALPRPTTLSTEIVPPRRSVSRFVMASPSPFPSWRRAYPSL